MVAICYVTNFPMVDLGINKRSIIGQVSVSVRKVQNNQSEKFRIAQKNSVTSSEKVQLQVQLLVQLPRVQYS
jgi:hypothetical protein